MAGGLDRTLRTLQSRGVSRGIFGGSRGWVWIAVASWVLRRLRQANGPELVYRAKLKPGERVEVSTHRPDPDRPERPRRWIAGRR